MALLQLVVVYFYIISSAFLTITSHAGPEYEIKIPLEFGYTGSKGPYKWGSLSPNFTECSHGKHQSPVNIIKHKVVVNKELKPLMREYHTANATLIDNGFNVGLLYGNNSGVLSVGGKIYKLKQMHWHAPSEHRMNGLRYAAELHLVHVADDGSVSVVATLYKYGHPDPLLAKIQKKLSDLAKEARSGDVAPRITMGPIHTNELRKHARKYYTYFGSFTTPPCTEHVTWYILAKVRTISRGQVEALRAPLSLTCKKNARPAQPLNGRKVELYEEEEEEEEDLLH